MSDELKQIVKQISQIPRDRELTKEENDELHKLEARYADLSDTVGGSVHQRQTIYSFGKDAKRSEQEIVMEKKGQTMEEYRMYTCKHCHQKFKSIHEIGNHMRHVNAEMRKQLFRRSQVSDVPAQIPNQHKVIKVTHMGASTRIFSTSFIPVSWDAVRLSIVPKSKTAVWVLFERI